MPRNLWGFNALCLPLKGETPEVTISYDAGTGQFRNGAGLWHTFSFDHADTATLEDILAATSVDDLNGQRSGVSYNDPAKILDYELFGWEYPDSLNAGGPDMWREDDFNSYTIMGDVRIIDNLYFNFAYNHQDLNSKSQFDGDSRPEIRGDVNKTLYQDDVANLYGIDPLTPNPRVGQLYFESQWRYQTHEIRLR